MQNKAVALITAAGNGRRLGLDENKVFFKYKNKFLIDYTLAVFEKSEFIKAVVLILNQEDKNKYSSELEHRFKKIKQIAVGGETRKDSVANGLTVISQIFYDNPVVFIHDGARPLVSSRFFLKLAELTRKKHGAVLGVKIRDTLKYAENGIVQKTVSREGMYQIQTPQSFLLDDIISAYQLNNDGVTDDAQVFENWGGEVAIVESDRLNFKITYPDDLEMFKQLAT